MGMFFQLEQWLIGLAQQVPVTWFVVLGAFIEEVVAPIPSPIIMTLSGSIARAQNLGVIFILWLSVVGALAKTAGSWVVYFIADKAEDLVVNRFGKYIGISHKEIESVGKYFNGGSKDLVVMALARAIPIMPTAPVSAVAGVVKVNLRSYLLGSLIGNLFRSLFYLYLGYSALSGADSLLKGLDSIESVVQVLLALIGLVVVVWIYYKRSKEQDILGMIKNWFRVK